MATSKSAVKLDGDSVFVLAAILLKWALEWSYYTFVAPLFAYTGFSFYWAPLRYLEGWILTFALLVVVPRLLKKPSDFFSAYAFYFILVPAIVYFQFSSSGREPLYYTVLSYLIIEVVRSGAVVTFPVLKDGVRLLILGLVGTAFIVSVWLYISGGARFFNLNVLLIYEFRDQVSDLVNRGAMGYVITWAFKVATPVLLALALEHRRWYVAVLVFVLQVAWFGVLGHKSVLFFPLITLFLWSVYSRSRALALMGIAATVLITLSLCVYIFFDDIIAASLLVRRVFFVPPQLTTAYYNFFYDQGFLYWSNSVMNSILTYPYDQAPAEVIGNYVGSGAFANNSFFASGYMHAGLAGMFFYAVLVGIIFRIIDGMSINFEKPWLPLSIVAGPLISMYMSADLPTIILTHGLAVAFLALFAARSAPHRGAAENV